MTTRSDQPRAGQTTNGGNVIDGPTEGHWEVIYRREGCIDDGGLGHDRYWSRDSRKRLDTKATTDEGALRAAKAWLQRERAEAEKWRCKSCGAGGCLLIGVEFVVPEVRRAVAL